LGVDAKLLAQTHAVCRLLENNWGEVKKWDALGVGQLADLLDWDGDGANADGVGGHPPCSIAWVRNGESGFLRHRPTQSHQFTDTKRFAGSTFGWSFHPRSIRPR
jgi:hypothetical protein